MRILVIEDDAEAASYLAKAFSEAGHAADVASDGLQGYALAQDGAYDVLVVDRMLPKLDGLSLIGGLRAQKIETPVLILSALGTGRRPCQRAEGGWRRLPAEALRLLGAPGARRDPGAPQAARIGRAHDLPGRPAGTRSPRPQGLPLRQGRSGAAARVPVARISDEERRAGRDPHDVARTCLGLSFRSPDQRHRRAYLAATIQDRQGFGSAFAPHHPRRRIHDP